MPAPQFPQIIRHVRINQTCGLATVRDDAQRHRNVFVRDLGEFVKHLDLVRAMRSSLQPFDCHQIARGTLLEGLHAALSTLAQHSVSLFFSKHILACTWSEKCPSKFSPRRTPPPMSSRTASRPEQRALVHHRPRILQALRALRQQAPVAPRAQSGALQTLPRGLLQRALPRGLLRARRELLRALPRGLLQRAVPRGLLQRALQALPRGLLQRALARHRLALLLQRALRVLAQRS